MFTDPLMASETENSLLVSGEHVLMQTALVDTVNLKLQRSNLPDSCRIVEARELT